MKQKKEILILLILIAIILFFTSVSYGFGLNDLTGNQVEVGTMKTAGNSIVKVISTIGVVVSVVMLIVLGIKYMIGSAEEKATYKKTLMPYVIGAVLVFAASEIAQLIYNLANQL